MGVRFAWSCAVVIALAGCGNESNEIRGAERTSESRVESTGESVAGPENIEDEYRHSMKVGDEWRLELESNATTGFQWVIQPGMDESVLVIASTEYLNPEGAGPAGAGGTQVFVFRAVGPGTTSVRLHYSRSWEDTPPTDESRLHVTVTE